MTVCKLTVAVLLTICTKAIGQTSIWVPSDIPGLPEVSNTKSVTLGLRFYSDVPGSVTGIRFYKGSNNIGTHVGNLWSSTGKKLASVTFSGETASGWQQADFSSPVSIAANTTYVISYLAPAGSHAHDQYYSWSSLSAGPLHVAGSSPGVYAYGSRALFPNSTWNNSNYWVDVVFNPAAGLNSFWSQSATPDVEEISSTAAVTLGLNFYSDVPGSVTGVRFYKGPHNIGTHIGNLWSGAGTKLASVTFTGETADGWQQANFSSPVSIAANTMYVISYLAPNGSHAHDQNHAWPGLSAAPLHVSGSSPGVFAYGSGSLFPRDTWNNSNYWVDVVFSRNAVLPPSPENPPSPSTYTISGRVSGSTATLTLSGGTSRSTTTDSSGNYSFTGLPNGSYIVAPNRSGYTFSPATATITINNASITAPAFTATAIPPSTFTISGRVSGSTATLTLSGGTSRSTSTDSSGNYSFTGLPNGSYIVAPSRSGYTFSPATATITITNASITAPTFTATAVPPSTFNISGRVSGSTATLTLSGGTSRSTSTDSSGNYSFSGLPNGSYLVAPSRSGYTFSPATATITINNASITAPTFTATAIPPSTFTISGRVSGSTATLTLSGATSGSTSTDSSGNYSFTGLPNGSYIVSPSRSGYTFSPATATITINSASITAPTFTATAIPPSTFTISGRVSGSAATLTLSGATSGSTSTDSSGNYSFTGLSNGSYIVAPSQSGYTFSPSTAAITINNASITGAPFTASPIPAPIPHSVLLSWNAASSNVAGFNVYRADVSGGEYAKVNAAPISATTYVDNSVASGRTYYYVATSLDSNNTESAYSAQSIAVVPTP